MRLAGFAYLMLAIAGICVGQEASFPSGPQYLIISGSPLFFHSIATPTMNLDAPLPSVPPPISQNAAEVSASPTVAVTLNPAGLEQIYWGKSTETVVEISSVEPAAPLPASIVGDGVTGMTDSSSLRERGYGLTLAEIAALSKAHKGHAKHVYTNEDLERLHGG